MKIIPLSPVLLVIFLSLLVIIVYLYWTSELMNKRKLSYLIVSLVFVFIIINLIFYPRSPHPSQKFRLAFFPLTTDNHQDVDQSWLLEAIPEMVARQLYRTVKDQAIVSPVERTYNIIKKDSLDDLRYLRKLSERINSPYYFHGKLSQVNADFVLHYQLRLKNDVCISDTISFSIDRLDPTIEKITNNVLSYFSFTGSNLVSPIYSNSMLALHFYMDGYKFFLKRNYPLALKKVLQAISIDSCFAEAYTLAGGCNLTLGINQKPTGNSAPILAFNKAKLFLTKAMELDSTNDENYRLLGKLYIYQERWSQAELMLDKAFTLNPNNPKIYIPFSRLHNYRYKKHGFSDEEQLYKRALFIDPCYEEASLILSDYYLFHNKQDQAINVLKQFLNINPNSVPILMALGKIYIVRDEMINIMNVLTKVINLDPKNSDAYYNLGILYYNSKDYENAKRFFHRAIDIDNHLNSYLYLAYISEIEGELDKAIAYLRKRIHFKTGSDDEFAEEARKHLYKLMHSDRIKQ